MLMQTERTMIKEMETGRCQFLPSHQQFGVMCADLQQEVAHLIFQAVWRRASSLAVQLDR
ncbi:hypothetical protein M514_00034 [Trichuris suis]|uniref:Uncharacterized protein n=1 Tax=Trichuris suis TaxID=68888 RepID=A0A085NTU8_9BILA|nr:hypothetical protein M513_00034 [Trichuris suis]KFD72894.1 hypothetical protein M514_00034 [Trichuris suis]